VNWPGILKNVLHCLMCMTKQTHCFVLVNDILKSIRTKVKGCCCVPVRRCWHFCELFLTFVIGRLIRQVYLLMPMDCTMLLHVKLTISHCLSSLITRQRASMIANCYTHREMSVIIAYLNDIAQTPLSTFSHFDTIPECDRQTYIHTTS